MGFIDDISKELAAERAELDAQIEAQSEKDEASLKIVRARITELAKEFIAMSSEFFLGRYIAGSGDIWVFSITSKSGEVIQNFGIRDDGTWGTIEKTYSSGEPKLLSKDKLTPKILEYSSDLPPTESGIASVENAFRAGLRDFYLLPKESQ